MLMTVISIFVFVRLFEINKSLVSKVEEKLNDFYIGVGPAEDEYKIDSKGLFLIIRNDEFPFDKAPPRKPLDYVEDQKSIEQAFNLLNEDGTPQANVYIGENLRDESVSDSDTDPDNVYRNKVWSHL